MPKWVFDCEVAELKRKKPYGEAEKKNFVTVSKCMDDLETVVSATVPYNCLLGTKFRITVETVENGEESVENAVSS